MIGCSCYTYLPQTAPAAAQTVLKMAAPGTGTGAPQMDQRLLTNTWPKQCITISIQANTIKSYSTRYNDRVDIKNAKNGAKTHKLGLKQGSGAYL